MSKEGYNYGAVSTDEEANKDYDESNLYYMKEEERTRKEKLMKAIKLGVPIIIAIVLIAGLGFLLFHNFAYFYPGRGGQYVPSKPSSSSSATTTTSSSASPKTTQSSHYEKIVTSAPIPAKTTASGGSCAAHPKCADLGLTGECCPTASGIKLNCCS